MIKRINKPKVINAKRSAPSKLPSRVCRTGVSVQRLCRGQLSVNSIQPIIPRNKVSPVQNERQAESKTAQSDSSKKKTNSTATANRKYLNTNKICGGFTMTPPCCCLIVGATIAGLALLGGLLATIIFIITSTTSTATTSTTTTTTSTACGTASE
ncbi:unnamed protein product [Rotaria socialis]|uniref:Uncharacterized protein n=1 Tax=Rotaria socialis TaxID=392032 RepID=A0A818XQI4_9BILA|nr:unnamed protein product [Rotaria socialis]